MSRTPQETEPSRPCDGRRSSTPPAIAELMRVSVPALFPRSHDARRTACAFRALERSTPTMPDGVALDAVAMERATARSRGGPRRPALAALAALAAGVAVALATAAVAAPTAAAKLPRLEIRTQQAIRDDPKVPARLRLGGRTHRAGIEFRGQTSQQFPKKPYAVETDAAVRLLGLPRERDWVLNAAYTDPTLMRDPLAHATARRMGLEGSRTRHVTLRLNGRYRGVYILMERPELSDRRVPGDALLELTGPLKLDDDDAWFRSATGRPVVHAEPDEPGEPEARAARRALRAFEAGLAAGDGSWRAHLDEASAIDYVLHSELFKNQDAFYSSTFLHLRETGRLALGPVWDLDLSAGNAVDAVLAAPEGWILGDRPWAGALLAEPAFRAALAARWRALRAAGVLEALLADAERHARALRAPARRNFARWRTLDRPVFRNQIVHGSHPAAVAALEAWFAQRAAWMDAALAGPAA